MEPLALALGLGSLLAFRRDRIVFSALLASLAVTVRPLMFFVPNIWAVSHTDATPTPSLVWHRKNPTSKELIIKTVAIDALVEAGEIPGPSFVKIDVEGGLCVVSAVAAAVSAAGVKNVFPGMH